MVPETEKKPERLSVAQVTKEQKNTLQNMESKVVKDAGGNGFVKSQANDVLGKINMSASEVENPEINVTDGVNPGKGDDEDATDDPSGSSSSFNDTFSAIDGALALSDDEVNSELHGSSQPSWAYPGYEETFWTRKKKLTSHWRNFVRPVMWRCKWAELEMKKFQTQAAMYSKILVEFDQGRRSQLENFSAESLCSRSLPFPHQMKRKKIMRRKKRNRVEDTTDLSSYMLQHNLFAYCENKGTATDSAHLINGLVNRVNPAVKNGITNHVDNDSLLLFGNEETPVERVLAKIDSVQSIVRNLTTRVDRIISENPGRFAFLDKFRLLAPCDSGASTDQYPTTLSTDKDITPVTSPSMTAEAGSEPRVEELLDIPITSMTAHPSADPLPNIKNADQLEVAIKTENAEDEIPPRKRPDPEDPIVYRKGLLSAKKCRMLSEKQPGISSSVSSIRSRVGHTQAQNEKSGVFLASRYTSLRNNQKKRAKRTRARSGRKLSKSPNLAFRS